jgi:acetamidase/formamidase
VNVALANHTIHRHTHHCTWDNALTPALKVAPGETVTLEINDASGGQITPQSTAAVFSGYDSGRVNPVTGPVYIDGAKPGDTLIVRLEHYAPSGWGWTANIPGFGLLSEDFPEAALRHWTYAPDGSKPLLFGELAEIPLAPFAGTVGVAPGEPGSHSIIPPRRVGGNMDIRNLVARSVLYLPVEVEGALFSLGDTHAAQGDGEVCGTAIESPMTVTLTLDISKGDAPAMPRLEVPGAALPHRDGHVDITTGIGPDLFRASQDAVRGMIDLLTRRHSLAAVDAYMLASVAGDLRISQIVDAPNWTVSFHFNRSIFGS